MTNRFLSGIEIKALSRLGNKLHGTTEKMIGSFDGNRVHFQMDINSLATLQ